MKGWVYVITNKSMPGLVKIGYSLKDPEARAAELNHTGTPYPYLVDYEVLVENPRDIEQKVHNLLKGKKEGKEWFRCSPEEAIAAIKSVIGSQIITEQFKRADRERAEAIRRQKEAEEIAKRKAEEARRQQLLALENKRQEIISRYEPLLKKALPNIDFWEVFFGMFFVIGIVVWMILDGSGKRTDSCDGVRELILIAIGAFFITPFIKNWIEKDAKKSEQYQSILKKRDEELAEVEKEISKLKNLS